MENYPNRANRPMPADNRGVGDVSGQSLAAAMPKTRKFGYKMGSFKVFTAILLGLITVLLVALVVYLFVFKTTDNTITAQIKTAQYQAIFLNSADGQVYFGKLTELNKSYYKLTDIYYVRVNTVQPDKSSTTTQQNISLAKLGSEIHGPEDVMYISKDKVLFWENLKETGQVVKAIRDYQKTGSTTGATPTPTATVSPTPTK